MILVTGAAGFIGAAVSQALLTRGERVIGVDNLNAYYDVTLKEARLERLRKKADFDFHQIDIADRGRTSKLAADYPDITHVVHLAAQAGVRYSLENPFAYIHSNIVGQVAMLELARTLPALEHFVYASSSSVYGANEKMPFAVGDAVDKPSSLYAATKRADELFSYTYAQLYGIRLTGLRFFTVYGPWGRPDMAPILFADAIAKGNPLLLNNGGEMWRDFTYIDDIVDGVLRAMDRPPTGQPPHALYNLGNCKPEKLTDFVAQIEQALQKKARIEVRPLPAGDVLKTYADIADSTRDLGFAPTTPISVGVPRFVDWFRGYYGA